MPHSGENPWRGEKSQTFSADEGGYTLQMPATSSSLRSRNEAVPIEYCDHMVASGSCEWARPRKCPASWVRIDWRSYAFGSTSSDVDKGCRPLTSMSTS